MEKSIIEFFPSPQMREAFATRITEDDTYLHSYPDQNHFNQYFNHEFGCGEIRPAYTVQLQLLLAAWRKQLWDTGSFTQQSFASEQLVLEKDRVVYQDITADRIIFCDGVATLQSPWFRLLPFSLN